ncbi:prepilin-type N-terminal cleavage/methylation domain-containing protein [Carnimonas nigrificans]|uniref:prepilin-type N-terminal cleavage/methylation domain-containing protein n=1 Tax=Carnimonas nigrificans TaxID=64323 RepID=UPI0004729466|nr:prepilin-type N-terminal cleavage/methylation domain-containing protein [Carnimonas nigrificans]
MAGSESGFALIELMAAMIVAAVGIAAVANGMALLDGRAELLQQRSLAARSLADLAVEHALGITGREEHVSSNSALVSLCARSVGRDMQLWLDWSQQGHRCAGEKKAAASEVIRVRGHHE